MADVSSTTWDVNYESTKYSVNTSSSGSFSVKIRGIERILFRSPSGRESLSRQRTLEGEKEPIELVSEIPSMFLAGEETCSQYVANVLSTTKIESSIQHRIVSNISKDAIDISSILREKEKGFLIKADVEVVKETSFNDFVCSVDYDSEGRRIPIEQDCIICLEKMSNGRIMQLLCCHNFHRDCILKWLRRKHSCPTCRNDIHNRPPHKRLKPGEVKCFTFVKRERRLL